MTNHDETYDTVATLAKFLTLSPKTIYRWSRADPSFPVTKVGRAVRFPRSRVQKWLNERTQGRRAATAR
jgi:excisionase family DNA binding protein